SCVLRFGFLQDGDVRIGVLPGCEEILVSGLSLGGVSLKHIGAAQFQARQRIKHISRIDALVVQNPLVFGSCLCSVACLQKRFSANIDREVTGRARSRAEFVRSGRLHQGNCLLRTVALQLNEGLSRRNIYTVEYCVGGKLLGQAVDQLLRTADVTDSCQHSCGYVSGSSIVRCTESLGNVLAGDSYIPEVGLARRLECANNPSKLFHTMTLGGSHSLREGVPGILQFPQGALPLRLKQQNDCFIRLSSSRLHLALHAALIVLDECKLIKRKSQRIRARTLCDGFLQYDLSFIIAVQPFINVPD